MALRNRLRRLERNARGGMVSIELRDGSRHWFEPGEVWREVFSHGTDCLRADYAAKARPEPPTILQAVARAKDRRSALERLYAPGLHPFLVYEPEALVERGEFVPRSLLAGKTYAESLVVLAERSLKTNRKGVTNP